MAGGGFGWRVMGGRWREVGGGWRVVGGGWWWMVVVKTFLLACAVQYSPELGARSWIRVPGVLGTRARGNAIFFKARGNAEREEVGTLISRA